MRIGVVDIGCNAIRFVIYEDDKIGAPDIFKGNFKHDLESLLSGDSFDVKHYVYLSIQHILRIFKTYNVDKILAVATEVFRGHKNGQNFVEYIKGRFGINIEILSGDKEAYLAALGLLYAIPNASGLMVDLGGGSLELAEISNKIVGNTKSIKLGTKIISKNGLTKVEQIYEIIQKEYGDKQYGNLYLIGGCFCLLSKWIMEYIKYPIKNIHNFEVSASEAKYCLLNITSKMDLYKKNISLYNALLVIYSMLDLFKPTKIIFSIFGLKDGVRFNALNDAEKNKDQIFERIKYNCSYNIHTNFDAYSEIVNSLTSSNKISDITKYSIMFLSLVPHFDQLSCVDGIIAYVLTTSIPVTHSTKIMVCIALSLALNSEPSQNLIQCSKKIISKNDFYVSHIIGYVLHIARKIDGDRFVSPSFSIVIKNQYLALDTELMLPNVVFQKIHQLLKSIAFVRRKIIYF